MFGVVTFEFPRAWLVALPLGLALMVSAWLQYRRGMPPPAHRRTGRLANLRIGDPGAPDRPPGLDYQRAARRRVAIRRFAAGPQREHVPRGTRGEPGTSSRWAFCANACCRRSNPPSLPVQAMLFDETAELGRWQQLAAAAPKGKRTNLAGPSRRPSSTLPSRPWRSLRLPMASLTKTTDNTRALTALVDSHVPFIGVGFGSDQGVRTLSLRDVEAPPTVSTKTSFSIAAQLEMMNTEEMPAFDLRALSRRANGSEKKRRSRAKAPAPGSKTSRSPKTSKAFTTMPCNCSRRTSPV